jgi:hypothetical protein
MLVPVASADMIVKTDGQTLQGTFKGGTGTAIEFEVNGVTQRIPLSSITTMTFSPRPTTPPPAATAPSPAATYPATVNAGTRLMIRTSGNIETGHSRSGDKFTAALETDFVATGGTVVAPKGTTVYGRVVESIKARRLVGVAALTIELTDIMINNQLRPIVTDRLSATGERQGSLRKVAAGAAVGGVADGSDGAEKGAAVGLAAAVLSKGKQIHVPAGTVLEFKMMQPLTISP